MLQARHPCRYACHPCQPVAALSYTALPSLGPPRTKRINLMYVLYGLLLIMLTVALGILAIPFIRKHAILSKHFFVLSAFIILFSISFYFFTTPHQALQFWLTQGEQHYQLLKEVDQLGGIDTIIVRIKQRLATNPNDAKGWLILGKLYLGNHNTKAAKEAFKRAYQLQPEDVEIKWYYLTILNATKS